MHPYIGIALSVLLWARVFYLLRESKRLTKEEAKLQALVGSEKP